MAEMQLTEGVIAKMLDNNTGDAGATPVCQVLSIKKLQTNNASANVTERYRVVLSDGVYYTQGVYTSCVPTDAQRCSQRS